MIPVLLIDPNWSEFSTKISFICLLSVIVHFQTWSDIPLGILYPNRWATYMMHCIRSPLPLWGSAFNASSFYKPLIELIWVIILVPNVDNRFGQENIRSLNCAFQIVKCGFVEKNIYYYCWLCYSNKNIVLLWSWPCVSQIFWIFSGL